MEPDTSGVPERPQRAQAGTRRTRAAVISVVGATVALAVGSSALALSGLRIGPVGTSAAVSQSGAPAGVGSGDGGLFVEPGPFAGEPGVVRALPQAPQPLPPAGSSASSGAPGMSWAGGGGSTSGPSPISPASFAGSTGGGMLGLPSLPQLISGPAPASPVLGSPGPGRSDERGSAGEGGGLLGLPPGLLDRPDDEKDRPDEDESGEFDRPGRSGEQPQRPDRDDGDGAPTTPSTPTSPSTPSLPSAPPAPSGDPTSVEQMARQAREQAMEIARERIAEEMRARRESEQGQAQQREAEQREAERRQTEQRESEQRRTQEQGRCDPNDPQPSIGLERDDNGMITAAKASGFGEGCVGKELRLEIRTEDGTVTSTSPVSDERSATFSLPEPVAQDKIQEASLSTS